MSEAEKGGESCSVCGTPLDIGCEHTKVNSSKKKVRVTEGGMVATTIQETDEQGNIGRETTYLKRDSGPVSKHTRRTIKDLRGGK